MILSYSVTTVCVTAICSAGYYRQANGDCAVCPRGTYQPATNATSCVQCAEGYTTPAPGATAGTFCISGSLVSCFVHITMFAVAKNKCCHEDTTHKALVYVNCKNMFS